MDVSDVCHFFTCDFDPFYVVGVQESLMFHRKQHGKCFGVYIMMILNHQLGKYSFEINAHINREINFASLSAHHSHAIKNYYAACIMFCSAAFSFFIDFLFDFTTIVLLKIVEVFDLSSVKCQVSSVKCQVSIGLL